MKRFTVIIVLCCAFVEAQAIVPLEIRATIQLPNTAVWDVQHCADDSTFGWAYVVGDTIRWVERLGDSVQSYTIPTDIYTPYGDEGPYHVGMKLLHLATQGDHLCAVLQSNMRANNWYDNTWSESHLFALYDLENQQLQGSGAVSGSYFWQSVGNPWAYYNRTIRHISPWPPMPGTSMILAFAQSSEAYGYEIGDHNWYEWEGSIFYSQLDQSPFAPIIDASEGTDIDPFANFAQYLFAITGYYRYEYCYHRFPIDSCVATTHSGRGTINTSSGAVLLNNTCSRNGWSVYCPNQFQLPQHDADGTNRLITEGTYAVSATTFDTLWNNLTIVGALHTMRIEGSEDERILAHNSQTRCFGIFVGSTGEFLDSTTSIDGGIQYFIKQPGRSDEIVTVNTSHLVRVYGSQPGSVDDVTCQFVPENNEIRLHWSAIPGAIRYSIYAASYNPDELYELAAQILGDTTCALPVIENREFFRVVAEFE